MAFRPHPRRARTDPSSPRSWGTCDRSGFVTNTQRLHMQMQWRGLQLMPTNLLVAEDQLDIPQRQLGTIVLSPDPVPVLNARPEQYPIDEIWPRLLQNGTPRYLQGKRSSRSLQSSVYFNTSSNF